MTETSQVVRALLAQWVAGDPAALNELVPLVYAELRRIAQSQLRNESTNHTLQPTALVHEAYVRLAGQSPPSISDRIHFLGIASKVMRQVLIDHARTKYAQKRGGRQEKLSLDEAQTACIEKPGIMVQIDDALNELEKHDPRKAKLVEMHFFGGMTAEESALLVQLNPQSVRRELRVAQAWLQRELARPPREDARESAGGSL